MMGVGELQDFPGDDTVEVLGLATLIVIHREALS
jgi:hypothetical protein